MSENYTKADLRHIAEALIEDLRECEDGTDITTWKLVKAAGAIYHVKRIVLVNP